MGTEVQLYEGLEVSPIEKGFGGERGVIHITTQQMISLTANQLNALDKAARQFTDAHPEITVFQDKSSGYAKTLIWLPTEEVEDWLNELRRKQGKPPAPWNPPPRKQPAVAGPPVKTNKEILRERAEARALERQQMKAIESE